MYICAASSADEPLSVCTQHGKVLTGKMYIRCSGSRLMTARACGGVGGCWSSGGGVSGAATQAPWGCGRRANAYAGAGHPAAAQTKCSAGCGTGGTAAGGLAAALVKWHCTLQQDQHHSQSTVGRRVQVWVLKHGRAGQGAEGSAPVAGCASAASCAASTPASADPRSAAAAAAAAAITA